MTWPEHSWMALWPLSEECSCCADTALALAKTLIPLRDSIKQALTSIQPNTESEKESAPSTA